MSSSLLKSVIINVHIGGCEFVGRGFCVYLCFHFSVAFTFCLLAPAWGKTHATDGQTRTITKITNDFEIVAISNVENNRYIWKLTFSLSQFPEWRTVYSYPVEVQLVFLQQSTYRGNEAAIKPAKKLVAYTVCSGSFILCLVSVIRAKRTAIKLEPIYSKRENLTSLKRSLHFPRALR